MKNLKLFLRDSIFTGKSGVEWNLPIMIGHKKIGLSSVQLVFSDSWNMFITKDIPLLIPVECSLIKENMWNQSGVLFTLDLFRGQTSYASKNNCIG
jgi:hypothetical protein